MQSGRTHVLEYNTRRQPRHGYHARAGVEVEDGFATCDVAAGASTRRWRMFNQTYYTTEVAICPRVRARWVSVRLQQVRSLLTCPVLEGIIVPARGSLIEADPTRGSAPCTKQRSAGPRSGGLHGVQTEARCDEAAEAMETDNEPGHRVLMRANPRLTGSSAAVTGMAKG